MPDLPCAMWTNLSLLETSGDRENLLSASITLSGADEIKEIFLAYQQAGVPFHQVLRREPWGAKTFIVKDPDDNLILFAAPAG